MARPKKDNADYFSHDADMRNDAKIKAVRRKFGNEGYAVWNMLLEHLTDCNFFTYELSELNIELLAGDFDIETELLKSMIDYFLVLKLIVKESDNIKSLQLIKRFESLLSKRKRDRTRVIASENPQSKVKESKGEESKVNNKKTIEERKAQFKKLLTPFKNNYDIDLLKEFFEYWTEHGLKDEKMKFEKQKSFNVEYRLRKWNSNKDKWKEKSSAKKESFIFTSNRPD